MISNTLLWEFGAFVVYMLYGSYFEWFFHRYLFHSPKYWYRSFREHTLVHHQIYKGDDTYYADEHDHPEKVAMDWWALLAMEAFHLPFFWLIQRVTHIPSLWGGVAAIAVYYGLYESLHWVMHVPSAVRFLWRFRWFRFLDTHHKVHHKYMLSNLNVILPLADITLGTLRDAQGRKVRPFARRQPTAAPQAAAMPQAEATTTPAAKPARAKEPATAAK